MIKIAVITATRAEYGLLSPVIRELRKRENDRVKIDLVVTGTHLSEAYGMTIREIEADGCRVDYRIPISLESDTERDISTNQAETLIQFTEFFLQETYNAVVLLGDRYEMLAIAIAAGNTRTPIFHLCGGDTTEGAIDEWIRHAITKISFLHFVTNEVSKKRVIQLGEAPARVFNYGSTSIDNILTAADMTKEEALRSVNLETCAYVLCTYHPVTMEKGTADAQIKDCLAAMEQFPGLQFIMTKSNADQGGARINSLLVEACKRMKNLHVFASLGIRRYLSLMKYSKFVLGNSSSGIIETPAFHIPTVNIGDRQRGRLQAKSIINCGTSTPEIVKAMNIAMSDSHRAICKNMEGLYGDGHAADKIAAKMIEVVNDGRIDLKKSFYDL